MTCVDQLFVKFANILFLGWDFELKPLAKGGRRYAREERREVWFRYLVRQTHTNPYLARHGGRIDIPEGT